MGKVDWYRSPAWSADAQADFEARLAHARPHNRPQYLRVKAVALAEAGARPAARELLARVIREFPDVGFEVSSAYEHLGDLYRADGMVVDGCEAYRCCLERYESHGRSGTTGLCDLSLVELILEARLEDEYEEALRLLRTPELQENLVFHVQYFRYDVAYARVLMALGAPEQAPRWARSAIERSHITDPQFPRHPDVGLVPADHPALPEMQRLVDAWPDR
jgi:tetratricopeptide (TPR) repeat protein